MHVCNLPQGTERTPHVLSVMVKNLPDRYVHRSDDCGIFEVYVPVY